MKGVFLMVRRIAAAALIICVILTFTACAPQSGGTGGACVVTSFYPIYIFTLNLLNGVDEISLSNMTEQNSGCLHDYRLVTGDMKLLENADLFIINGAGMETFLSDLTGALPNLKCVDSSEGIELIAADAGEETHHSHVEEKNAHIWLLPENAIKQVNNIAFALEKEFPDSARLIEINRTEYTARLQALADESRERLSALGDVGFVSFHEAYNYLCENTDIRIVASIETDDGGEPSGKELAALTELIKSQNITALFTEPDYRGSAAEILSRETGAKIYIIDPVTSGESDIYAYENIMRNNLSVMEQALGS